MIPKYIAVALSALALGLLFTGLRAAADDPARVGPATSHPALNLLGDPYLNASSGIALRPPLGCSEIHEAVPNQLVQFAQDKKGWIVKVSRVTFQHKTPLDSYKDQFGNQQSGLLQMTLDRLTQSIPQATQLRNETVTFGKLNVGMLAMRFNAPGDKPRIIQQAIIESPFYPARMFYLIEMTSPGRPKDMPAEKEDPGERDAADTFDAMLQTVELLDLQQVAQDQEDRLFRTRALFTTWNFNTLQKALVPEQWFRIIQDGKDVGYVYEVQEIDPQGKVAGKEMMKIGMRSRTFPEAGSQLDEETWMYCTVDRKHETWSTVDRKTNAKGEVVDQRSEVGSSDESTKAVEVQPYPGVALPAFNPKRGPVDQGNVDLRSERVMNVRFRNPLGQTQPVVQELAPWYIPLAVSHLLPRILPLNEPRTYMMAIYVSDGVRPQIEHRYVDVCPMENVGINGRTRQAVPIKDRIGLEGPVTIHYVSPDGQFLESVATVTTRDGKPSTYITLPTDSETLHKLWPNPDLTRPAAPPAADKD